MENNPAQGVTITRTARPSRFSNFAASAAGSSKERLTADMNALSHGEAKKAA
jgi:hypothetical protein